MGTKITNPKKIGVYSVDSLKIRLELNDLQYFDESLNDILQTVNPQGESEKEFKRSAKQYDCGLYSVYASTQLNARVGADRYADVLTVLVNSKHLGSAYFEGITLNTVKTIYNLLTELNIFKCSFDTFLNAARYSDVDFKNDFELEMDEYKELCSVLQIMTKPSSNRDKGCTPFTSPTNYGIAWSVRETSKYKTSPYLKVYHKGLEFSQSKENGGSKEFKDHYLPNEDVTNRCRIETTVKNKQHFESLNLGLKDYTLRELLSLTQAQMKHIMATAINAHLSPRTKSLTFKTKSKLTPSQRIQLNSLLLATADNNFTIDRAISVLLNGIQNKVAKSRNKRALNDLYFDHIKGTDYDSKTTKIESVLDTFGWL
jgi:hypothetical protein